MKHIYFVRHGETLANRKSIHQSPDEPLTLKGKKQIQRATLILKNKQIDTIISSPYTRARESAQIISTELNIPFYIEKSITEFRRPNYLYNKGHFSIASLWYIVKMFLHRENPKWNDDGAENMFAIRNRVTDCRHFLEHIENKNIVVVSHNIFMNIFLDLVCSEKKLTYLEFLRILLRVKGTKNGSMIHLYYDETVPEGMCQWQLIEYISNEHTSQT